MASLNDLSFFVQNKKGKGHFFRSVFLLYSLKRGRFVFASNNYFITSYKSKAINKK